MNKTHRQNEMEILKPVGKSEINRFVVEGKRFMKVYLIIAVLTESEYLDYAV